MSTLTIAGFVIVSLILLLALVAVLAANFLNSQYAADERRHGVEVNGTTHYPEEG